MLTDFGLGLAQDKEPSSAARHLLPRSPLTTTFPQRSCESTVLTTFGSALPALEARILELHPYDTPEVVALEPAHVEARYLAWLRASVGSAGPEDTP